jgi:PBP1b-binding outer membrane lipoprotein LpoB
MNENGWILLGLSIFAVALLGIMFLAGCASEPDPPIRAYREAYGFTP